MVNGQVPNYSGKLTRVEGENVGEYAIKVGSLTLVDNDKVSVSNINRQIIALHSTVGKYKTDAMRDRIADINPSCAVTCKNMFYDESTKDSLALGEYDYVLDCIDSVSSKVLLIAEAKAKNCNIISAMGAGNKLDPSRFKVSDISKTTTDPLARAIRGRLKKLGINHLKVVFSDELPTNPTGERTPGSVSFVPSVMGLIMAGEVIKDLALKE
jgi:tRNA A37 threonylcarbamoyladenosine dehydratase